MILPLESTPHAPTTPRTALADAASPNAKRGAAGGGPLGTTAKSSDHDSRNATRALRYQALSQARQILRFDALKISPDGFPGDVHRTADCRHLRHSEINVMYSQHHSAAFYAGLVTCGSVWSCPVCASRIQERRRLEIEQAISWATSLGLVCVLVTFTFPHRAWQLLRNLITQQRNSFKRLRYSKGYRKIKPVGLIRSLEVTHGTNGWHPHTHELWFCEPDNVPSQSILANLWKAATSRAGLLDTSDLHQVAAFLVHSVDVKRDMTSGDYLAKQDDSRSWGFSHEVAKATSKAGRRAGVHPHHFLVRKAPGDDALFLEYHLAMKGARQLFWSPGLKSLSGVTDLTDEVLADESRDPADILAHIPDAAWTIVRNNDAHAEILDAAESGGAAAVRFLLASLGFSPTPLPQ